ncbi:hypothetical protein ACTQZS_00195 [Bilifractor sp. LCP19S3_H10]|uniref:hypothetical protein n=1 Tax=Bilifractor sp. LCP19S3_H10 TaxID=3438736 RepID=UPI003F8F5499
MKIPYRCPAGKPFEQGEKIAGWRACEVEGGAYVNGRDVILCDGSSAVFRYISLDRTPQEVITDCSGDGKLTVLADGKAIAEAEPETYEIKVTCKGDVVLHSVTIQ